MCIFYAFSTPLFQQRRQFREFSCLDSVWALQTSAGNVTRGEACTVVSVEDRQVDSVPQCTTQYVSPEVFQVRITYLRWRRFGVRAFRACSFFLRCDCHPQGCMCFHPCIMVVLVLCGLQPVMRWALPFKVKTIEE